MTLEAQGQPRRVAHLIVDDVNSQAGQSKPRSWLENSCRKLQKWSILTRPVGRLHSMHDVSSVAALVPGFETVALPPV